MTGNRYRVGDVVRLSATFELSSVLTNPTTVSLCITAPDGNSGYASPIINDSTGKYHYDFTVPIVGSFKYRFYGTGAIVAQASKSISIDPV